MFLKKHGAVLDISKKKQIPKTSRSVSLERRFINNSKSRMLSLCCIVTRKLCQDIRRVPNGQQVRETSTTSVMEKIINLNFKIKLFEK